MKALAIALVAMGLLAGCGGGSQAQPAGSIKVSMSEFQFEPASLNAPSGKVVFWLVNSGRQAHNMIILDTAKHKVKSSDLVAAGDVSVFTVDNIAAGSYTIICDQQGHEASGMKGTLTIS
jgi:plastocyanin